MNTRKFLSSLTAVAVVAVLFTACNKDSVKKEVFSGYAQKGPFVIGSSVTIFELDASLDQTGKTYLTTISGNSGSFEQKNIELVSNYVELKADGYFWEEISGFTSMAPIALYALVDVTNASSANVNVLTHLEKQRVEYLVKQEKKSFSAAKKQAQNDVLAIFGFNSSQNLSEALNLTDNAMLIAISCILQGNSSVIGDLAELMANIAADIKTDGVLDNVALRSKLVNNAIILTTIDVNDNRTWLPRIRENLEAKYDEMGINVTIPDFESYIQGFVNSHN
ncbi:MAG: hypothetical protein FWH36_00610 [Lentimicrobiaceae bacterium]|nr:hypothetical protein [Lentimicrobiaceae bacterium]